MDALSKRLLQFAFACAGGYALIHSSAAALRVSGGGRGWGALGFGLLATTIAAWLTRYLAAPPASESVRRETGTDPRAALPLLVVLAVFVVFVTVHRDRVVGLREDESFFLQFPSNYARHGQFMTRVGETLSSHLLFATGTGPTLLAPAAWWFERFGVSLAGARAISSFYVVMMGFALCLLLGRAAGVTAAIMGLVALMAMDEMLLTARMFMGDFAAVAFLVLGGWLWLEALDVDARRPRVALVLSGLAFGLMVLTKNSFALAALGFGTYALIDRYGERRIRPRHLLVPAVLVVLISAPWEFYRHSRGSRSMLAYAATDLGTPITAPKPMSAIAKGKESLGRPEFALAMAGIVFGLGATSRRLRRTTILFGSIGVVWLLWFLTFDIPNYRYLIVPSVMWIIVAAPLVAAAFTNLREPQAWTRAAASAVLTVGLLLPGLRAAVQFVTVIRAPPLAITEQNVASSLAELLAPGAPVYSNAIPFGVLFFDDRPVRIVREQLRALPSGSIYLLRGAGARPVFDQNLFDEVNSLEMYTILKRAGDVR